jgi:predicted acyl esterase
MSLRRKPVLHLATSAAALIGLCVTAGLSGAGPALATPARAAAPVSAARLSAATAVSSPVTTTATYQTAETDAQITTSDGVVLAAKVYSPVGTTGLRPMIVIPSAWGGESGQMSWSGTQLAQRGFISVNYATRGFKDSGGESTTGGPRDIQDVSNIIDWMIAHTATDPARIGMFGVSYGAGLSLEASAFDPRIKAVGSLEGYADLLRTAYPNQTRSVVMVAGLLFGAVVAGKLDDESSTAFNDLLTGTDMPDAIKFAQARSPINVIDQINRNHPAIMMATSWNDIAYGTDQITDFWKQLTGPKRLEVRPGDHVVNEVPGAAGLLDTTMYQDLFNWFTTYIGGVDTPIVHQPAVWMQPRSSGTKPAVETYPDWPSVTTGQESFGLGAPTGTVQATGPMDEVGSAAAGARPWSQTIDGDGSVAGGIGAPVLSFAGEALTGQPPKSAVWAIDRSNAVVFQTQPFTGGLTLRGNTDIRINVTPSESQGTIMLYLYDTSGTDGYLISHRPYSWHGATPGKTMQLDVPLQPTAYNLPAGHDLAVAVSSGDLAYANDNPSGAKIQVGSTAAWPAGVTVSLGK